MKQSELTSRPNIASKPQSASIKSGWLNLGLLDGLLLISALLAAWLPVDWTRDLKRIKQAPLYAWLGLGYFLVYAFAVWWAFRRASKETAYRNKWLALAGLVLLPNLLNIWLRSTAQLPDGSLLFGRDADIGLFYKYAQDFAQGHFPTNFQGQYMEYPQFALFIFWFGYLLCGGQQAAFYWVFPVLLTVFQLGAAFALYGIGRKIGQARAAFLLAAFVAGCPALFSFSYTRFDVVPAAFLLASVYFFLPAASPESEKTLTENPAYRKTLLKIALSGIMLTAGGLIKWLPAIITPWLVAAYVQARRWRQLFVFGGISLILTLLTVVPFYLWNAEAFWYPYKFQGSRKLIGESFWFLLQRDFFDPEHLTPEKPWGEPSKVILGNNKLLVAQLGLTLLVLALSFWRLWWVRRKAAVDWSGWAAAGLIGVAVFTFANRIFSPQYLILLSWVWVAALLLRSAGRFSLIATFALVSIVAAANFQVYLLGVYPEEWVRDSWIMFGAGWLLTGWLLWRTLKRGIYEPSDQARKK